MLDHGASAWLREYYSFTWRWSGNLGADLLIIPLAKLVGLEQAARLDRRDHPAADGPGDDRGRVDAAPPHWRGHHAGLCNDLVTGAGDRLPQFQSRLSRWRCSPLPCGCGWRTGNGAGWCSSPSAGWSGCATWPAGACWGCWCSAMNGTASAPQGGACAVAAGLPGADLPCSARAPVRACALRARTSCISRMSIWSWRCVIATGALDSASLWRSCAAIAIAAMTRRSTGGWAGRR